MDGDEEALADRWPLPDWTVDSKSKQQAAAAVVGALGSVLADWPRFSGDQIQRRYAEYATAAVRDALAPFRSEETADPLDLLADYVAELALIRPGEAQNVDRYRDLLRRYARYLDRKAKAYHE